MSLRSKLSAALGIGRGLWPKQTEVPPPRVDASSHALEMAAVAQLQALLDALPAWDGAIDAQATNRATYGHTHVHLTITRTDPLAVPPGQRQVAAYRSIRDVLRDYVKSAQPGDGFRRHFQCGDSELVVEIQWSVL